MRVVGLVPLPPSNRFSTNARVTFSPDTVCRMNDQPIGRLISAKPTDDRESLELEVELYDGIELPPMWAVALGGDNADQNHVQTDAQD